MIGTLYSTSSVLATVLVTVGLASDIRAAEKGFAKRDASPTQPVDGRERAAVLYADALIRLAAIIDAGVQKGDDIREELRSVRTDLDQVDKAFRRAKRTGDEDDANANLAEVGGGRWLPPDQVADIQARLMASNTKIQEALDALNTRRNRVASQAGPAAYTDGLIQRRAAGTIAAVQHGRAAW